MSKTSNLTGFNDSILRERLTKLAAIRNQITELTRYFGRIKAEYEKHIGEDFTVDAVQMSAGTNEDGTGPEFSVPWGHLKGSLTWPQYKELADTKLQDLSRQESQAAFGINGFVTPLAEAVGIVIRHERNRILALRTATLLPSFSNEQEARRAAEVTDEIRAYDRLETAWRPRGNTPEEIISAAITQLDKFEADQPLVTPS